MSARTMDESAAVLLVCALVAVLTLAAAALTSCSSGSRTPPAHVAGQWRGEWTSATTPARGAVFLNIFQDGRDLTGFASFAGAPCMANGVLVGTLSGAELRLTVPLTGGDVLIVATSSGSALAGGYRVASACGFDNGTLTLEAAP